jgi:methylated-DNA-[protein]-cysteine S-methyltransferase
LDTSKDAGRHAGVSVQTPLASSFKTEGLPLLRGLSSQVLPGVSPLVFCPRPDYENLLMPQLSLHTPLGTLTLSEDEGAIVALDWGFGRDQQQTALLRRGREQLHAYFDGSLKHFDLPLAPSGSPYRRRVWEALAAIPFGETRTYADIARVAGGSARSVGGANGANPIPIIIPCHRVVGSTGLGGYSGADGIETKLFLLDLEKGPAAPSAAGQARRRQGAGQLPPAFHEEIA